MDIGPATDASAEPRPTDSRLQSFGPALALAGLFFYSLTWTFSAGPPAPATASVRDLDGYERSSGQLGTTSTGEFLPLGVTQLPDPRGLEGAYALHSVIERLGPLPAGVAVESQDASLTSAQAVLTALAPAQLTFDFFDFPGWQATVDGQPAPIIPSQPNGLITITVPTGRHSVQVVFGNTPLRTTATALSFIAAGLLAIIASGRLPLPGFAATPTHPHTLFTHTHRSSLRWIAHTPHSHTPHTIPSSSPSASSPSTATTASSRARASTARRWPARARHWTQTSRTNWY